MFAKQKFFNTSSVTTFYFSPAICVVTTSVHPELWEPYGIVELFGGEQRPLRTESSKRAMDLYIGRHVHCIGGDRLWNMAATHLQLLLIYYNTITIIVCVCMYRRYTVCDPKEVVWKTAYVCQGYDER